MFGKNSRRSASILIAQSALAGVLAVLANHANAATQFFDVNSTTTGSGITNGGSYTWEGNNWTTTAAGTGATAAWAEGNFPEFAAGTDAGTTTVAYTVTAASNHTIAGMFMNGSSTNKGGGTVTVSGALTIAAGVQGFLIDLSGQTIKINASLGGTGGIEQEDSGQLSLFGNNSYTGGTQTTGGQVTNYNNANSFGTGSILLTGTSGQGFVNAGAAGVTIANNLFFGVGGTQSTITNFASGSGVAGAAGEIWSGKFNLPTTGTTTLEDGAAGQITQISGIITGSTPIIITNPGMFIFSGANNYTGTTTVTQGTLKLGAANTIATTSSLILNGGTFDPGGINQAMSSTTLGLTASSILTFVSGGSEVDFSNSSAVAWTAGKILNLTNWDPSIDKLRFGTDPTGLTSTQLAEIEFNGAGLGTAGLGPQRLRRRARTDHDRSATRRRSARHPATSRSITLEIGAPVLGSTPLVHFARWRYVHAYPGCEMKITGIRTRIVEWRGKTVPLPPHFCTNPMDALQVAPASMGTFTFHGWLICELETDTGIVGIGNAALSPQVTKQVIDLYLKPLLIGADPWDIELLWQHMYRRTMAFGRKGIGMVAISAVDIALWDILGKSANQPVYRLLGGRTKAKIPVYASRLYSTPLDELRAKGRDTRARGTRR